MTRLGERDIYLVSGRLTQTINVCDASNRRGYEFYDWIVRITEPFINEADVVAQSSILALIEWLRQRGGLVEKRPPEVDAPQTTVLPPAPPVSDLQASDPWAGWIERAVQIVEQCIDRLVIEFLEHPYQHRVEHSVHAELFAMLASHRHLSQRWPMADGRTFTQPLHKEWPETLPRPEKGNRRGNFDLAILSPGVIAQCDPQAFSEGLARGGVARPCIAIEAGLNYLLPHLGGDAEKLANSAIRKGYLLHLIRNYPLQLEEINALVGKVEPSGACRIAYAGVNRGQNYRKLLHEAVIRPIPI